MALTADHSDLITAAAARIQSLGLTLADGVTPLASAQVVTAKLPTDRIFPTTAGPDGQPKATLPGIIVSLPQDSETIEDGNFEEDYIGYPILVTHVFAANQGMTLDPTPLAWRKAIRRAFHEKQLPFGSSGAIAFECKVFPQLIINVSLFREQNLDIGGLLVRAWPTEERDKTYFE